ncbi:hypothetical protein AS96_14495 [Microbacterium sp. MRS-1]|nr:hypothetical protein AS96_14495 [Microbacterium sp. MRS-1]
MSIITQVPIIARIPHYFVDAIEPSAQNPWELNEYGHALVGRGP